MGRHTRRSREMVSDLLDNAGCSLLRTDLIGVRSLFPVRLYSGLYLKENGACHSISALEVYSHCPFSATEVEGTFRVSGSNKRMRDLQALFETPPKVRPCRFVLLFRIHH